MHKTIELKIFHGISKKINIPNPVITIGTFDGVHLGHQKLIDRINYEAEKIGGESVLFTFYPHPRTVLFPDSHGLKLIQTQEEKLEKLEKMGLQNVIEYPFTMKFSRMSALEFTRDILVNQLHVKKLVIGYDHQFGKNREGTIDLLKEISETYGFEVIEIPAQEIDEVNISSTKIRNAVLSGNMEKATSYLGEPFEIKGKVVPGQAVGRGLGFPTANVDLGNDMKLLPGKGVYAVEVVIDGLMQEGMMNIGVRPTLYMDNQVTIEVHMFDFNDDIYGKDIQLRILSKFRDEMKFSSKEELMSQLKKDEETIRAYFNSVRIR